MQVGMGRGGVSEKVVLRGGWPLVIRVVFHQGFHCTHLKTTSLCAGQMSI